MEIRRLKVNEFEEAIQLADRTFREPEHISMRQAFPHVFSTQLQQSFCAFDGDKLVSFMGLVPSTIRVGESILNVYSLGAVCTREEYRHRGISTAILKEVYQYIEQAGASLLFVSGDRGMYLRNHCYHFGRVTKYTINGTRASKKPYAGIIRQGMSKDLFEIDRIRREKEVGFESSIWEWSVLVEAGGYSSIFKLKQELFVAVHENRIEAYVVIGMPTENSEQGQATVTEWGGDPNAVYAILQAQLEQDSVTEIDLTLLWHEEFNVDLSAFSNNVMYNGGTVYIANKTRLIDQLMPYIQMKNAALAHSLSINDSDEGIELRYGNEVQKTITMKEFVQLIFDPQNEIDEGLNEIFPIPLPNLEGIHFV